jgi:hypothetical protein
MPMMRSCERVQAQMFIDILRREVAELNKSVVKAETRWRHRCEAEGDVDPPERLMLVRGRIEEVIGMLDAFKSRFPSTK